MQGLLQLEPWFREGVLSEEGPRVPPLKDQKELAPCPTEEGKQGALESLLAASALHPGPAEITGICHMVPKPWQRPGFWDCGQYVRGVWLGLSHYLLRHHFLQDVLPGNPVYQ